MPQDPVADRLRTAPVADAIKASAWDAYESATDADDLAIKLRALPLPESVKADLWDLKASAVPEVAAAPVPAPAPERSWLDTAKDVGTGLAQSAVGSFVGAGELIHKIPGVSAAVDTVMGTPGLSEQAFTEARQATTPQNAPQSIGKFAGDIAQVLVPGSKITQAGQALARMAPRGLQTAARAGVEAVAGGTQAAIQGGDPTAGAVFSGAIPFAGQIGRAGVNAVLGGVRHTAAEAAAVKFAEANKIPLDAATATGRRVVGIVQKRVSDSMGGAGIAEGAKEAQANALTRVGGEIAERVSDTPVTPEQAGSGVRKAVERVVNAYGAKADAAYDTLRTIEADPSSLRTVRMKVKMTDSVGQSKMESVTLQMPLPVNIKKVQAMLKPIYEQMNRQMPPTIRDASRGYQSIKAIMESPEYMPASIIDTDLSQIKSIVREAVLPGLRNKSQGLAAAAVKELDAAVQQAVAQGGPKATAALEAGRLATRAKYAVGDVFEQLRQEPVQVFRQATWAKDAGIGHLRELAKVAPSEMPRIGRAYVDEMLAKATGEGGFDHARSLWSQWQNLGPETKKLIFPNAATRTDLDNFFLLAKKIADNPNPSGTAGVMTAFNIMSTVPSWMLAKVLYSPAGVRQLTKGITTGQPNEVLTALGRVGAIQASGLGR